MKYVVRRAVASVVLTPLVACGWVFVYASLILIGGEPSSTIGEVFTNGMWLGAGLSVWFVADAIVKVVKK
jgi:hypothetical protein